MMFLEFYHVSPRVWKLCEYLWNYLETLKASRFYFSLSHDLQNQSFHPFSEHEFTAKRNTITVKIYNLQLPIIECNNFHILLAFSANI